MLPLTHSFPRMNPVQPFGKSTQLDIRQLNQLVDHLSASDTRQPCLVYPTPKPRATLVANPDPAKQDDVVMLERNRSGQFQLSQSCQRPGHPDQVLHSYYLIDPHGHIQRGVGQVFVNDYDPVGRTEPTPAVDLLKVLGYTAH
jgi:hypothetical protein